jgi:histidinol-phosphate aminotransferase
VHGRRGGALSAFVDLPAGCKLILGNGSDELIDILSVACNRPGATLLAPLPGFVMYEMSARLRGLQFVGVPLTADFELDEAAMLAAIERHRPALTYIAYPNNPTANLFDDAVIDRIVAAIGPPERPGGVRRGLPALLVTQPGCSLARTSTCW